MRASLRLKRTLATAATGALVLGLMPVAAFADTPDIADFTDICENSDVADFPDRGSTHAAAIDCMTSYDVIQGFEDGTFGTSANISRQQFASLVFRFAGAANPAVGDLISDDFESSFTDVTSSTHGPAIAALEELGIIQGTTPTTFSPNADITRSAAASVIKRAHDALEVEFPEVPEEAPFTDLGATHEDNIVALWRAGVIAGVSDTLFGYSAPVQRGQVATFLARSAGVLDAQDLWAGDRLPAPSLEFILLDDDLVGDTPNLNTDDSRGDDDLLETDNLLALSDGEAVTVFQFSVADDNFFVEGNPVSISVFAAALEVNATLEATPTADGFDHNLTPAPDVVLEGVIGNGTGTGTGLGIVDPASGIELFPLDFDVVAGQSYTVDGDDATQTEFLENLNVGDFLEIDVVFEDEDTFADSVFQHNLTNETLEGVVGEQDGDSFTVDPNADDDGVVTGAGDTEFEIPGFAVADPPSLISPDGDDIDLTIDGDSVTVANIGDVVAETLFVDGGDVTYERVESDTAGTSGDVTIVYDSDMSDTVSVGYVTTLTAPTTIQFDDSDSDFAGDEFDAATADVVIFDGVTVAATDLDGLLSAGDQVTLTEPFDGDDVLSIVSMDIAGEVTDSATGAVTMEFENGQEWVLDVTTAPFEYTGTLTYFVDGSIVNQSAFDTAVDDALDDEEDVTIEVLDTATQVQFRVTIG